MDEPWGERRPRSLMLIEVLSELFRPYFRNIVWSSEEGHRQGRDKVVSLSLELFQSKLVFVFCMSMQNRDSFISACEFISKDISHTDSTCLVLLET